LPARWRKKSSRFDAGGYDAWTEFAFSSEDAIILAYGSFGLEVESQTLGVDAIVATDIRLG
jgi:hypothetical protein